MTHGPAMIERLTLLDSLVMNGYQFAGAGTALSAAGAVFDQLVPIDCAP
ncbi:MAG: hypothetical protein NVS3B16_05940 [Vulcanimicrobiaceae bacterium]